MNIKLLTIVSVIISFSGCGLARPPVESEGHINTGSIDDVGEIPATVSKTNFLPEPEMKPRLETYTVIVSDVPVKDRLF